MGYDETNFMSMTIQNEDYVMKNPYPLSPPK
jgi:hypothetical protein